MLMPSSIPSASVAPILIVLSSTTWRVVASEDVEKASFLTRPTLARRDAPCTRHRSHFAQILNVEEESLGRRKHCRGVSVRQDLLQGRTTHTKCGLYLLRSSLVAASLNGLFEHPHYILPTSTRRGRESLIGTLPDLIFDGKTEEK